MRCGPVDLFSSVLMMVSTSSLEMCAIKKLTSFLFSKYKLGLVTGFLGILLSVLGPTK